MSTSGRRLSSTSNGSARFFAHRPGPATGRSPSVGSRSSGSRSSSRQGSLDDRDAIALSMLLGALTGSGADPSKSRRGSRSGSISSMTSTQSVNPANIRNDGQYLMRYKLGAHDHPEISSMDQGRRELGLPQAASRESSSGRGWWKVTSKDGPFPTVVQQKNGKVTHFGQVDEDITPETARQRAEVLANPLLRGLVESALAQEYDDLPVKTSLRQRKSRA